MNKKAEQQIQLKQRRTGHPGNAAPGHIHASDLAIISAYVADRLIDADAPTCIVLGDQFKDRLPFDCLIFGVRRRARICLHDRR